MNDNREMIVLNGEQIDELVRCKDCKYWDNHDGGERCLNTIVFLSWAQPNSYCSYGERKEVEE